MQVFDSPSGAIWLFEPNHQVLHIVIGRGWFIDMGENVHQWGKKLLEQLTSKGQPFQIPIFMTEEQVKEIGNGKVPDGWGGVCCPLQTAVELLGMLLIAMPAQRVISEEESQLLTSISEIASSALHWMRLHEETLRRLSLLQSLRTIDQAISSLFDLRLTLDVICAQALAQLAADAVGVMLYSPEKRILQGTAGRGFGGQAYFRSQFELWQAPVGRVASERNLLYEDNIQLVDVPFTRQQFLNEEGFIAYAAAPLVAKGKLKGVLEVFHRSPFQHTPEWLDILQSYALQATIAIDNVQMFEHLQQLNAELVFAYDATIEGWSKALELKDKETEGHSQHVVEWTLKLAQALGVKEEELVRIRRGALLHDIGKMGIPDSILVKAGPLEEKEW